MPIYAAIHTANHTAFGIANQSALSTTFGPTVESPVSAAVSDSLYAAK